jgi:hypothetical protein
MITTTLNRIREHPQCKDELTNLLAGLGKTAADDDVLPFATILKIIGLDDALWCCRAEPQHEKEWRLLMVAYARRVEHLITVPEVKNAIDVAERHANGEATNGELHAAWDAASAGEYAAEVASWAAERRWDAGWGAARGTANVVEGDALWNAAEVAERKWQEQEFLRVVTETGASDG